MRECLDTVEAHAYICGHAADGSHTRESMPAVCSSSTSVVLKTGYSHVLCMAPYTSRHACWVWLEGGGTGTVQHVGVVWYASKQHVQSVIPTQGCCTHLCEVKWHDAA